MLQIVYTVPSIGADNNNPVALTTFPTTGGAAVLETGAVTLSDPPVAVAALGPQLVDTTGNPSALVEFPWFLDDGSGTRMVAGAPSQGKFTFAFPLGEQDWLIGTRTRVGRVVAGTLAWSHPVMGVGTSGINCMISALVKRGSSYYVFAKANPNNPTDAALVYYTAIDLTGTTPPGLFTTWASTAVEAGFFSFGLYGHEAVPLVLPDFDVAIVGDATYSGDGVTVLNRAVITGPAQDVIGGKEYSGFGVGESFDDGFQRFFGAFTATLSVSGGVITECVRAFAPPTYSETSLEGLIPPGTYMDLEYGGAFLMIGDPPPEPPFWTQLRRAVEVI